MRMRIPCKRVNLARASCALSCTTVLVGMIALFSNHWICAGEMHAGFVSGCYGDVCASTVGNIPENFRAPFVVCLIVFVFMPLILIFTAAILQAFTALKGPQKHRDLSALILAWLSGYQSLLLLILIIAATAMIPSSDETDIVTPLPYKSHVTSTTPAPYYEQEGYLSETHVSSDSDYSSFSDSGATPYSFSSAKIGWSGYFGLLAALLSLASAVSASLYYGKSEKDDYEDTIPLEPNVV
ncbi:uncharacterized protein LOC132758445 [Ruditapes philippinarum]|uniref:uncharacterized protein LOC132758445 n=1 Tax=Ruditapes philippinarum TaxID=129788 RepID=UPI00295C1F31|nr:uncharacterized protein LOC132758445 [Ruditapes philippinarum]